MAGGLSVQLSLGFALVVITSNGNAATTSAMMAKGPER
jgi:hypothetical protein